MITGIQLRFLRQARGMVQKELALKMNIAQQRLSILEKNKHCISDTSVTKVLQALKFTREEAMKLLNDIPPFAGGGKTLIHFSIGFRIKNLLHLVYNDKNAAYIFLLPAPGCFICTAYTIRSYKNCETA